MKKKILLILLGVMPLVAMAQPSWVKKATKSVFTKRPLLKTVHSSAAATVSLQATKVMQ